MGRKRTSKIWQMPTDELRKIVAKAKSISEILRAFELSNKGHNYKTLKKRLKKEGIDYSHIPTGAASNKGRRFSPQKSIEELFRKDGVETQRSYLKKKIIKDNLIPHRCQICGGEPSWQEKPLILILDHINGISTDHRLENLRFLCPNCNSQQDTFAGRNIERDTRKCESCGKKISSENKSGFCVDCWHFERAKRANQKYPSIEQLIREVDEKGLESVGLKYKVTGTAIWKRIKKNTKAR